MMGEDDGGGGGRWGVHHSPSNVGAVALNRNVSEDMIKLYKLSNLSFISLQGVHGHNECCISSLLSFPGSPCSHSLFGLLLPN